MKTEHASARRDDDSVPYAPAALTAVPVLVALLLSGCGVEEVVMEPFRGATPHERYVERLDVSGLARTALARDWIRAAEEALTSPVLAEPPMAETGRFAVEAPLALGYRFEAQRGQRIRVSLELEPEGGDEDAAVFIDLFRIRGGEDAEGPQLLTVAWGDSLARELVYQARASASYLVRVQPEVLRGGPYRFSLEIGASLAFPLEGADTDDIRSFFGAARDGGARDHHGVDIFAPRGTPVLAASAGRIRRVNETPRGGKVVWLRSAEHGHSEYYAHLDSQLVASGQRVDAGDTLGLVGNTGNAITTPPHLHFGIYERGPADPLPYLDTPEGEAAALRVARALFHTRARIRPGGATIREGSSGRSATVEDGEDHLLLDVLAGSGEWARVRLPDGRHGFVHHERLEPMDEAVGLHRALASDVLRGAPDPDATGFRVVAPGSELEILARYGEWAWVRTAEYQHPGWFAVRGSGGLERVQIGEDGGE